jgi:hypothetical protein
VSEGLQKFFNAAQLESDIANIDWNTCRVLEKIDGSNIRLYFDLGKWHVATLGCVDAAHAEFLEGGTYKDLVIQACGGRLENLTNYLDINHTYIFELVGPNRIVIDYGNEPQLYYLGRRNMATFIEDWDDCTMPSFVLRPHFYSEIKSYDTCVKLTDIMDDQHEGYVVASRDDKGYIHRVKIKGQSYIALHRLRGNGILTVRRVIEMWQNDTLDDFMASFPQYNDFIKECFEVINFEISRYEYVYNLYTKDGYERKNLAAKLKDYKGPITSYVFARLDGKVNNPGEFLKQLPYRKLGDMVAAHLKTTQFGEAEDE